LLLNGRVLPANTKPVSRNPWAWIPTLYFAQGLPNVLVASVSVVVYKNLGLTNTAAAFYTSWLYLPWVLKPLWSPVVDILRTRRWWIWTMQLLVGAGLASVALTVPTTHFLQLTLAFFWLMAFASATHDIAADGFYILANPEKQQAMFSGVRGVAFNIAKITAQFLAYVNQLKAGDVDVAGEFIYIASLLIHIKSKMLLPRAPSGPEDAAEDPRRELVERLLEHERFKNAAQMLQQKQMLEAATWTNPGMREFKDDVAAEPEIAADTDDLVRIFRDVLDRIRTRPTFNVQEDSITVGQMIQFLARRLIMEDKPVALRKLLSHTKSERALVAMFLALLELVRLQAVLLRQDRAFSEIFVKKQDGFDAVMNESASNARDDWK